ncbi:MAG: pyridoxal phosphate-dependent aminotransferase [Opitutales bacterium]|nr:pyridoxal phosphate-dependent aminotransferase [Opitutales bacterium]
MKYDFDKMIDRRGSGSCKWDEDPRDVIPLWIADMDFEAAPCIIEALRRRVEHGVFGYTHVGDDFYNALTNWFRRRHGWEIGREQVLYTPTVVPAVSATIKALCAPGDAVVVLTPVYNCFFSSIRNNGCRVEECPLVYGNGTYTIDFEDFERRLSDPGVKMFLHCNPHNPAGRVWTLEEQTRIAELCKKYGKYVVSDEIHCELVMPGCRHLPFATVPAVDRARLVSLVSSSKAFNTAGLQIACAVVPDAQVRAKINRAININEVCDVNPFGVLGLIAAYNGGEDWLEELISYVRDNYRFLCEFFKEHFPQFEVCKLEATYLAWVNIKSSGKTSQELTDFWRERARVRVAPGAIYGNAGEGFVRINLACPRERLKTALERLASVSC